MNLKVIKEADGLITITSDKPLYALESGHVIVVSTQRIKKAEVQFYTGDEYEKAKKRYEKRVAKSDCLTRSGEQ